VRFKNRYLEYNAIPSPSTIDAATTDTATTDTAKLGAPPRMPSASPGSLQHALTESESYQSHLLVCHLGQVVGASSSGY